MVIRSPAVADLFYPSQRRELQRFVSHSLEKASIALPALPSPPKAIIVPHAGFIYSGQTAAYAYASIWPRNIHRVVLLGPSHRVAFYGMAVPFCDQFETPLGKIEIDSDLIDQALLHARVETNDAAHAQEHSLEVQLPFLQHLLGDFTLLPICIGSVEAKAVAQVIESLWHHDDTLFVISSDLSHFHSYQEARRLDQQSIQMILNQQAVLNHEQACGATGINALLKVSCKYHLTAQLLDYKNSGDSAGDKESVVGYTSVAFFDHHRAAND